MFGRVMNTALHILAFRLKYFPVEGAFNDCDTVKLKNKRTNKGYMDGYCKNNLFHFMI